MLYLFRVLNSFLARATPCPDVSYSSTNGPYSNDRGAAADMPPLLLPSNNRHNLMVHGATWSTYTNDMSTMHLAVGSHSLFSHALSLFFPLLQTHLDIEFETDSTPQLCAPSPVFSSTNTSISTILADPSNSHPPC